LAKTKTIKNLITAFVVLLAISVFGFISIKLFFSTDRNVIFNTASLSKSDPSPVERVIDKTEKMTTVCENDKLLMQYDFESDLIVITDKATGTTLRSYPEISEQEKITLQKKKEGFDVLTSPIIVGYTTTGKDVQDRGINQVLADNSVQEIIAATAKNNTSTSSSLPNSSNAAIATANANPKTTSSRTMAPKVAKIQSEKIANIIKNNGGLQLIYKIPSLGFEITAEFTLEDNAVVSFIPRNGLKETVEDCKLMSIITLPYFGAARQGDTGYFVTPDGSGALTKFDSPRISRSISYEKQIYGSDMTFADTTLIPEYSDVNITMPVIGTIKPGIMLSSFAIDSEEKAFLVLNNPGDRSLPFYRSGFKFALRNDFFIKLSKSSDAYRQVENKIATGNLKVKTYIDIDVKKDFTYVDVAQKAKEILLQKWKDKYGIDKKKSDQYSTSYLNLKVFLGAENRYTSTLKAIKVMTTFDEVQQIYSKLKENGIKNVRISLLGWTKDGYFANATDKFAPETSFGGTSELKKLIDFAKAEGIELSIENNDLELYAKPKNGISLKAATVKRPGTEYLQFKYPSAAGIYRNSTDFYILNPLYFKNNILDNNISKINEFGVDSIDLTSYGDKLFTNYSMSNPLLRQESLNIYVDILKKYESSFKNVSVYYGNDYAASVADKILDIPVDKSYNAMLDEAVPFIQIVYHGLIDYYSDPINNADHPRIAFLKSIEYGAFPSYELTYRKTDELKYTYYDKLFSSDYLTWLDDVTKTYNSVETDLVDLKNETITNHYKALDDKNVYCTEYSNGSKIYVNYEESTVNVNDLVIEGLSYLKVVEGR